MRTTDGDNFAGYVKIDNTSSKPVRVVAFRSNRDGLIPTAVVRGVELGLEGNMTYSVGQERLPDVELQRGQNVMISLKSWGHVEVEIASLDPDYDCDIGRVNLNSMNALNVFDTSFRRR